MKNPFNVNDFPHLLMPAQRFGSGYFKAIRPLPLA
jgi:hypothetical protein